jgi:enoyl-[acyl-carrier protein] reductase I
MAKAIDLTGKVAFLCGASSEKGYGWAIAKELAEAGATLVFGSWPMGLKILQSNLRRGKIDEDRKLSDGSLMEISKIYPMDALYDTPDQVPEDIKNNKRYKDLGGFTIQEVVDQVKKDYGQIDILVHALANGPEVDRPLLETSREGYLTASSASAYSLVSMVQRFGPIMKPGGSVISLSYCASTRVMPGYGGGMSSAKAQLESDTRYLSYEAGKKFGIRVNSIAAGPMASRAASSIGGKAADGDKPFIFKAIDYSEANSPLSTPLVAKHIADSAFFLLTDMSAAVTGQVLNVDMGLHAMGMSLDSPTTQ